jgi:LysM repeat protein
MKWIRMLWLLKSSTLSKEKPMDQSPNIEMKEVIDEIADRRTFSRFQLNRRLPVFRGMGVLFLFAVFPLLFGCGDKESSEDLISIKSRLDQVEKKLTQLEGTGQKLTSIEKQIIKLEQSVEKLNSSSVYKADKGRYHVVRRGDSLSKIAKRYDITVRELSRLNRITPKTLIRPGQKLLVSPGSER